MEITVRPTTPGNPVYVFDVVRGEAIDGLRGDGPVVLAVDNLPCQLPLEASEHFADTLARFVPVLAECEWERPLDELGLPRELAEGRVEPGVHIPVRPEIYGPILERLAGMGIAFREWDEPVKG